MQKLEHDQLLSMMLLQHDLNVRVNPNYVKAGNVWMRAAWIETAEFMEHIGWKWWKRQEPNMPQARIELVDIWHFMLSEWLQNKQDDDTFDDCAAMLLQAMYDPDKWKPEQQAKLDAFTDVRLLADAFAHMCAANIFNAPVFARLMELSDLSWAELYRMFVMKNVLNTFRQDNGYKDGTYIKMWNGAEDNVALEKLMADNPTMTPQQLLTELAVIYSGVLAAR